MSERVCPITGKYSYRSPEEANRRRKKIRRYRDERLSSFRCKCGLWHLGHRT